MSAWNWASASHIGTSHLKTGQRLQDARSCFVCASGGELLVAIVSDGAGSAEYGGQGASLVCRRLGSAIRRHFAKGTLLPTLEDLEGWVDEVRDCIYRTAELRGKEARDFAATMICAISDGRTTLCAHIGDGAVVLRERSTGRWVVGSWPDHGEYASTTTFVTDQPAAKLRVSYVECQVDVIAAFSDGIERLVLDMAAKAPAEGFFGVMALPVLTSEVASGRDHALSKHLKAFLGSEQVCARTDDDKTLIIAALR